MSQNDKWQPVEVLVEEHNAQPGYKIAGIQTGRLSSDGVVSNTPKSYIDTAHGYKYNYNMPVNDFAAVKSPLDVMNLGYKLIENGWIKGHLAVDNQGLSCDPWSDFATRWCVLGSWQAILHFQPIDAYERSYQERYLNSVWNLCNLRYMMDLNGDIPSLNDPHSTELETILKCYRRVIDHFEKHPEANKWSYKKDAPEPASPKPAYYNPETHSYWKAEY